MRFNYKKIMKGLILCFSSYALIGCDNKIPDFFDDLTPDDVVCEADVTEVVFKQVAYWSENDGDDENDEEALEQISMLTHIIYNNVGVDANGDLILPTDVDDLEDMLDLAENAGVLTMISIGNDSDSAFNALAADNTTLNNFIDNVGDLVDEYDLDGIDISWQFPTTDDEGERFEELMENLESELHDDGKLFTFAVASGEFDDATDDGITAEVLAYPDFINVLALDSVSEDDLHSSLRDATEAIDYWTARCVVKNKIVLAIPAFSRDDDNFNDVLDFAEIVEDDIDYACLDESEGRNYNGIPTVTAKTAYAQRFAGGVILTALEQDYFEDLSYSLLATIDAQVLESPNDICQ